MLVVPDPVVLVDGVGDRILRKERVHEVWHIAVRDVPKLVFQKLSYRVLRHALTLICRG